ncbi:hypothetical protein [Streptomyces sp. NPDC091219]
MPQDVLVAAAVIDDESGADDQGGGEADHCPQVHEEEKSPVAEG